MKKTELIFIIDSSGSMTSLQDDTIGGFNSLLEEHRKSESPTSVTIVTFDSYVKTLCSGTDIQEVEPLTKETYRPGGFTALLDAVGQTIELVQNRVDDTAPASRPDQTLCIIITDGQENSSHQYNKAQIQKMIRHQESGHAWKFMFLGANMDAVAEATSYGISTSANYTATKIGTQTVYDTIACALKGFVNDGAISADWAASLNSVRSDTIDV